MKILLQQDDCAPDSLMSFGIRFKEITGVSFRDWVAGKQNTSRGDYSISFEDDTHMVSCDSSDPYWTLYEK